MKTNLTIRIGIWTVGFLLFVGLPFSVQPAGAATYSVAYQNGGVYLQNITVGPGTQTFTVTGVPKLGATRTDWYITDTGGSPVASQTSYVSDPSYSYGLSSGSYIVRAELYINGTWTEVHRWYATVQKLSTAFNSASVAPN